MTSMIILEHIPNFMLAKLFLEWIYKMIICNLLSMRNSAIPKKKNYVQTRILSLLLYKVQTGVF